MNWSQFEGPAALRCTAGVAIPLVAGLRLGQPSVSAFGAVGAVSVGFGSFQGAYRSRAAVMLCGGRGMALSIFVGSLAGRPTPARSRRQPRGAFGSGLLVALGPAASFVGLQSVVAVLIAGGFPSDAGDARCARRRRPRRRPRADAAGRDDLAAAAVPGRAARACRSSTAAWRATPRRIPPGSAAPPEPHTFAATRSRRSPIRSRSRRPARRWCSSRCSTKRSGSAPAWPRSRRSSGGWRARDPACARSLPNSAAARWPRSPPRSRADASRANRTPDLGAARGLRRASCRRRRRVDALLGQFRAAWRIAGCDGRDADDAGVARRGSRRCALVRRSATRSRRCART